MLKMIQLTRFDKLNAVTSTILAAISTVLLLIDRYLMVVVFFTWTYYVYIAYRYSGFVGKKFKLSQYIAVIFMILIIGSLSISTIKGAIQFEAMRDVRMIFTVLVLDFFASFIAAAFLNSIFAKRLDVGQIDH